MEPHTLSNATGSTLIRAARFSAPLEAAMHKWGIKSHLQQAAFLGQIAHESQGLSVLEENLNYSAKRLMAVWPSRFRTIDQAQPFANNPQALAERVYGGRMGNTTLGDGWNYRGRGLKQLTGKENYLAYMLASGADVLVNPDLLLEPQYAADSAGWFWHANGCGPLADDQKWEALTRRINGGLVGHAERLTRINRALVILGNR